MENPKEQSYENHRRFVPMYHFVLFFTLFLTLIGAGIKLAMAEPHSGRALYTFIMALSFAGLIQFWFGRGFATRVQDRAIRAEENMRHFVLTGKLMDARLTMGQIIALRFTSDEEFLALAKRAADENMKSSDIKKAIKNWKADHHRA